MPDTKPADAPERQPASVLFYTGKGEEHIPGVPATDLTEADIARLVYVESVRPDKEGLGPSDSGYSKAREKVVDRLTASPLYRKTAPKE